MIFFFSFRSLYNAFFVYVTWNTCREINETCVRPYLRYEWFYLTGFFVTKFLSKPLWPSKSFKNSYQRVQMIDILLKYILLYDFLSDLDAQCDFEKHFVTKKPVK